LDYQATILQARIAQGGLLGLLVTNPDPAPRHFPSPDAFNAAYQEQVVEHSSPLNVTPTQAPVGSKHISQTEVVIAIVLTVLMVTIIVFGVVWHRSQAAQQHQSDEAQATANRLLLNALACAQADFKHHYPALKTAPIEQIPSYVQSTISFPAASVFDVASAGHSWL
jgi:hypothetical protein